LGVRPLTELQGGEARLLERPRSRLRAMDRLVVIMKQRVGRAPVVVNIMEAGSPEDALAIERLIQDEINCQEMFISQFSPVMGAHTGPGLLGVASHEIEGEWNHDSYMESNQAV